MQKIESWIKNNKDLFLLVLLLTLGTIALFLPSWLKGCYFVSGGDVRTQTYPFFVMGRREWISALKNGTLPFYSWYGFLGSNLWDSKAIYSFFDVYNFIGYLIPLNFWAVFEIQNWLRIVVSGITFYLFAQYLAKNNRYNILFSICYGLSSYAVYFTSAPHFVSFYSFVPLYFLGIEKYFRENKKTLFIFSIILLITSDYYLFFPLSLFTPIYFLYRYINVNGTFKGWFLSAAKLIGFYLIGVMVVGVIIVPSFFYIIQNSRVGYTNFSLFYDDFVLYAHLIISSIIPSHTYIYGQNVFDSYRHTLKEVLVYSGSVVALIVPQIFSNKSKTFRWSTIAILILLAFILLTPIGGSAMNGFSEVCFRWTFILIFMLDFIALQVLNEQKISNKIVNWTLVIEGTFVLSFFFLSVFMKGEDIRNYSNQVLIVLSALLFMIINAHFIKKNEIKKVLIITFIELTLYAGLKGKVSSDIAQDPEEFETVTHLLAESKYDLDYYLNGLDEDNNKEFFRVYVEDETLYWNYSSNMNLIYGVNGLETYDSMYSQSFNDMLEMNYDEIAKIIGWDFNIRDKNIMNYLCTKYSFTSSEDTIPFDDYEIVDNAYRGWITVALNKDYKSFGRTYNQIMNESEFLEKNKDTLLLNEYIICSEEDYEEIENHLSSGNINELVNISYSNNHLSGTVESDASTMLVLSLPYDEGWEIKVNGNIVNKYKVNGGTIAIPIEKGTNEIEMNFIPYGFEAGLAISIFGIVVFVVIIIKEKRKINV